MTEVSVQPAFPRWLLFVMALACGVGVSNLYFPQALIPLISSDLGVPRTSAALVATLAQAGYAVGIFFLVPLGDRLPRRWLIPAMFVVVAVGLFFAGTSGALAPLYIFSAVIGIATCVPQMLIPMVSEFAAPGGTARLVALLQAGLLAGILLSRAFGGLLGQSLGWRSPYLVSGVLAALIAVTLVIALPNIPIRSRTHYPGLIASAVKLFLTEPEVRRSCLYQGLSFGAFSAAWTTLVLFLTGPDYRMTTGEVGLIALVSAGSVILVPLAGRMVDKRGQDFVSLLCMIGILASVVILLSGLLGGVVGIVGLILGMLVLDVSVQSSQIANQARVFAVNGEARSRLNSVYMSSVFLGGAAGSAVGAFVFASFGWLAVCGLIAVAAVGALARHLVHRARLTSAIEQ